MPFVILMDLSHKERKLKNYHGGEIGQDLEDYDMDR